MQAVTTASYDASVRAGFVQGGNDGILWLRPGRASICGSRRRQRSLACLRQIAAVLGVSVALNLSSAGVAFAPAALALDDVSSAKASSVQTTADTSQTSAADAAGECDESEVAEMHRNDVRRLLAEGQDLRDPDELLAFGAVRIPRHLVEAILRASEETSVDPAYMMALADKESSFSTRVKAATSSAEGLFQFVNKTWLEVVRDFGARHGLQAEAAAIETVDGELKVADEAMRERVLGLRRDPYISAVMAAEMMKKDRASITQRIGRELRQTEFYLAHFFGADGASRFMKLLDGKPKQSARRVFPKAAKANRPLFVVRQGKKTKDLTVAEVYEKIDRMIDARLGRYRAVITLKSPEGQDPSI